MGKYYKISDVAKILGISSELIRHYERMGILKPKRNSKGYRSYTTRDINILTGSRRYIEMGFSLETAEFLLNGATLDDVISIFSDREKSLTEEIRWKMLILNEIRQSKGKYELIRNFDSKPSEFNIVNSPPVYRINCQNKMTITLEEALSEDVRKWIKRLPIVRISPEFPIESISNGTDDYHFGYLVDENLAEELDLLDTPGIKFYPSQLCLTTIIRSKGEDHIKPNLLQDAINYIKNNGMEIIGDAWGITIGNYTIDGIHKKYHLIYIPIKSRE